MIVAAVAAEAARHVVGAADLEAGRILHLRHRHVGEAERAAALLAIEMHVHVVDSAVVAAVAELARHVVASLHHMHQLMLRKERQRPEYTRLVDRRYLLLEHRHRHRGGGMQQRPDHQYAVGGRPYPLAEQYVFFGSRHEMVVF